jgi:hypothetical protein
MQTRRLLIAFDTHEKSSITIAGHAKTCHCNDFAKTSAPGTDDVLQKSKGGRGGLNLCRSAVRTRRCPNAFAESISIKESWGDEERDAKKAQPRS